MTEILRRLAHQIDCADTFNTASVRGNDACWSADGCQPWHLQNDILRDIIRVGLKESGWRPIETAPKDGTIIFSYWPGLSGAEAIQMVSWSDGYHLETGAGDWVDEPYQQSGGLLAGMGPNEPTHWMPLPEGPK